MIAKLPFMKFKSPEVQKFIEEKTHNSTIFLMTIENNLQFFSFMCFTQMIVTAQENFFDKIKVIVATLVLFAIIIYSIAGYFILRSMYNVKVWSIFLEHRKLTKISFYLATIMLSLRSLLMGFCHGYLQDSPDLQGKMIVGIDLLTLVTHTICWKANKSKVSSVLLFFYYLIRLSFDVIILNEISLKTKSEYL